MPRASSTKPQPKRGKNTTKAPRSARPRSTDAPLTPAEQEFRDKLKPCLPKERLFIRHRLAGRSQAEAARLAGYSAKSAEDIGVQLSGRLRVWEAYQAGLSAAGFGPQDILADIRQLRAFDRSQIEREVKEIETVLVERQAEAVIQEIITKERAVMDFLAGLEIDDDKIIGSIKDKLAKLLHERLELEQLVAINPDAVTFVREPRAVTNRVIDYDRARELGLLKFIKTKKPSKYGDIVETYDWMDGVEMGARAAGIYVERKEISGPGGGPIQAEQRINYDDLPADQIADAYAKLLGQADEA